MDNDFNNSRRQWSPKKMRQYPLPVLHSKSISHEKAHERERLKLASFLHAGTRTCPKQDTRVKSEKMLAGSRWLTSISNNELRIDSVFISPGYSRVRNIQRLWNSENTFGVWGASLKQEQRYGTSSPGFCPLSMWVSFLIFHSRCCDHHAHYSGRYKALMGKH